MPSGIKLETLRELVATGTTREAVLIAQGSKWTILIRAGMSERPLITDRGHVREFGKLETAVGLLHEAGLGRMSLDASNWSATQRPLVRSLRAEKRHPRLASGSEVVGAAHGR
jgi:hypothetical protein